MAEIAPLTPLRYDLTRAPLASVIAPPYDVISEADKKELLARHAKGGGSGWKSFRPSTRTSSRPDRKVVCRASPRGLLPAW